MLFKLEPILIEHVIDMLLRYCFINIDPCMKTIILETSCFRYLTLGDTEKYKSVKRWQLNYSIFLMTTTSDSKINWDYNLFDLMIIHAF